MWWFRHARLHLLQDLQDTERGNRWWPRHEGTPPLLAYWFLYNPIPLNIKHQKHCNTRRCFFLGDETSTSHRHLAKWLYQEQMCCWSLIHKLRCRTSPLPQKTGSGLDPCYNRNESFCRLPNRTGNIGNSIHSILFLLVAGYCTHKKPLFSAITQFSLLKSPVPSRWNRSLLETLSALKAQVLTVYKVEVISTLAEEQHVALCRAPLISTDWHPKLTTKVVVWWLNI